MSESQNPFEVLLIDEPEASESLRPQVHRAAAEEEFRVHVAEGLDDALRLLRARSCHAILLDLAHPGDKGIERLIRLRREVPDLPIVALTATDDHNQVLPALRNGAQDCLSKRDARGAVLARSLRHAIQRKRVETIDSKERMFRNLAEHSPVGMQIIHNDRYVYLNSKLAEIFGYTIEEMMALESYLVLIDEKDRELVTGNAAKRLSGEVLSQLYVFRGRRKDGSAIDVEVHGNRTELNGQMALIGTLIDITERKRASEQLRESEERFRNAFEHTNVAMVVTDMNHRFVRANAAFAQLFGYSAAEILTFSMADITFPDDVQESYSRRRALLAGEITYFEMEKRYYHKDGHILWGLVNVSLIRDALGQPSHYIGQVQDITERKRAERRSAAEHAITKILAEETVLEDAVRRILQTLCVSQNWHIGEFWRIDQRGGKLKLVETWTTGTPQVASFLKQSQHLEFERGVGLPGRIWQANAPIWVLDVAEDNTLVRKSAAVDCGLHAGLGFPIQLGNEILGTMVFFSQERLNPDHLLLRMLGTIGIQVGQYLERKRLEEKYLQSQKMEAFGQLAGGVAHDFNNLLTVIIGYSDLLLHNPSLEEGTLQLVEEIHKAGDRAAGLTRQLLAFSRRQLLQPVVLNLNAVTREMEKMLCRLIGEDIDLATFLDPRLSLVRADPSQVEQVILNLVVNARDAMPQGGRLTIETRDVELDEKYVAMRDDLASGTYVMLAVSDSGCGMTEEVRARIFEPFFTTKEVGQGTGLGLATVHGIVKQSGGHIEVYSEPGHGSVFKVYLPVFKSPTDLAISKSQRDQPARGNESILLVEDEDGVRGLATLALKTHGYQVHAARNGREALELVRTQKPPVKMLVTDVVMPEMSGHELAQELVREIPGLKVLYVSGYTDEAIIRHGIIQSGVAFLQKPFTPALLVRKIREVLDAPSPRPR